MIDSGTVEGRFKLNFEIMKVTKEQVIEALDLIQRFKDQSESELVEIVGDKRPIEALGLTTLVRNSLLAGEVYTIGDLMNLYPSDLREFRGIGVKSLQEINDKMNNMGLSMQGYF